jgi:hypothetical protein
MNNKKNFNDFFMRHSSPLELIVGFGPSMVTRNTLGGRAKLCVKPLHKLSENLHLDLDDVSNRILQPKLSRI